MLGLTLHHTCPACGTEAKGVLVNTYRVNKGSLRSTGAGLGLLPGKCECGQQFDDDTLSRVTLQPDDLERVNAPRRKKGWPEWPAEMWVGQAVRQPNGALALEPRRPQANEVNEMEST